MRHCDYDGGYRYYTPKTMITKLYPWEQNNGIYGKKARRTNKEVK